MTDGDSAGLVGTQQWAKKGSERLRPTSPSDRLHCPFIGDFFGVVSRQWIGVDNIMWSSDYPHTAFTLPPPRDIIERDFRDASGLAKCKIVREKVAQPYGFDLD